VKDKIVVEYWLELQGSTVKSGDDFYRFADHLANFATVGVEPEWSLADLNAASLQKIAAYRGKAKVKIYREEDKAGSLTLELPAANFDQTRLDIHHLLGVIAGDVLGNPEIRNVKILNVELPESLRKHINGPTVGLDGVKKIFNLGKRPLLAFTMKPRLGLDADDHARLCYLSLKGGADIAEDDERLVNPAYCNAKDRVRKCTALAIKATKETKEKKIYSVNLSAREDKIIPLFEELDAIAKNENGIGLECVKLDVPPVSFGGLQALSEYLHSRGRNVIITVYPELYWFYRKLIPASFLTGMLRWCGADVLYAGTPVILEHFGEKGKTPSIVTTRLAEMKHDIYEGALWNKEGKARQSMPTVTGSVYPVTMDLLYSFLGENIGFFIGAGMLRHETVEQGARACRKALDAAVQRAKYTEVFKTAEIEKDEERFKSNYIDPQEMVKRNPELKRYVEVPF
jgi:ribulose-bisphosphate carboxylase large chain